MNKQTDLSAKLASSVRSLRDFLEFLASQGQCITWPDGTQNRGVASSFLTD